MKIVLEFDDFSPKNSNLGLLEDLKDHYKGFKVTLFTVPYDIRWGEPTPITGEKFTPFCKAIRKSTDWIEIALHGLTHLKSEFKNASYDDAKKWMMVGEKMFINRAINYAKIFKAPHWDMSPGALRAAKELGFTVAQDGYYNWNLKDDFPKELITGSKKDPIIVAHGHIQNVMGNGLEEVMPKLLTLPVKNIEFMFLSEYLKVDIVNSEKIWDDAVKKGVTKRKKP